MVWVDHLHSILEYRNYRLWGQLVDPGGHGASPDEARGWKAQHTVFGSCQHRASAHTEVFYFST